MLILNAAEVHKALPMPECIAAMKRAYIALSSGEAEVPLRARLPVAPHNGVSLFMPAYLSTDGSEALAVKIVSVFDQNPARGLPLIHAAVVVLDPETGAVQAILEGGALTAIRTGAGCGAATDLLARKDASTAAIFGAGVQARTQLEAMCAVREIETAWVYAPTPARVEDFIAEMAGLGNIPADLRAAGSPKEALQDADIIAAATTASRPVFAHTDLKAGAHINGAGSYTPQMQEIPAESVAASLIAVDSVESVLAEAGDIIEPLEAGLIALEDLHEIGALLAGNGPGRGDDVMLTFFKSCGVAVQDAAAGQLALANALREGIGTQIDW